MLGAPPTRSPARLPQPTAQEIEAARVWLAERDPVLAKAHAHVARFDWRARPAGFAGLVQLIAEQQVSVASAAAIWARVVAGLGELTAEAVLAHDEAGLKAFGLSAPKARYTLGIAAAHAGRPLAREARAARDPAAAHPARGARRTLRSSLAPIAVGETAALLRS